MRKNYNLTNSHHKDGQEQAKKIYRSISDHVKRLDDARGCANQIADLFKPSTQVQRSKLQEYCERLIFAEPLAYGTKAEELLWRKGFYDVIATAKRLKKQDYTAEERAGLIAHINAGIGHYHHYVARLQTEFELPLEGTVDFFILDLRHDRGESEEVAEWAMSSVHRSLIYLGDLSRYKLEVYPNWDPNLSIRYYSQALHLRPEHGMPHNQMGTLASSLNQHLDAAYHYIQCMMCEHSFEGTENNLHRIFEKNSQYLEQLPVENPDADCIVQLEPTEHIRRFIARFLLLTDVWFFNKKIPHVYDLCHQTNLDLQECLSYLKPVASESSGSQNGDNTDVDSIISPSYLNSDMLFKIIVICLQCITKLQKNNNKQQLSNVVAFSLAVYSQLIQHVLSHIQEGILNIPVPENAMNMRKKRVLRRRKKLVSASDEESDFSDGEISVSESDTDSLPDTLDVHSSSDDDDEAVNTVNIENGHTESDNCKIKESNDAQDPEEILKKSKLIDLKDLIDIITDEIYLQSIKILTDWLMSNLEILKSCGRTTRSLFVQVTNLLNILNVDQRKLKKLNTFSIDRNSVPLPEDVLLKNMEIMKNSQNNLAWDYFKNYSLSRSDEAVLRIGRLVSFGHFLEGHPETGVSYNSKSRKFVVTLVAGEEVKVGSPSIFDEIDIDTNNEKGTNTNNTNKDERETKGQLMGQLWLAAEVRDLETRVKGKMSLSPYLVVDVEALINYMNMVRQLVHSRKFIVLVPSAVLSALDDQKKDKPEARDAIRWLEMQFAQGNRFFRAQRAQERLPLPFIKYPKKKDKESFIFIQIIECCHFLAEQQKGPNMVTLLMGDGNALHNSENREISYVGLAKSAGTNLEPIAEFYVKWKKTSKNKGKR